MFRLPWKARLPFIEAIARFTTEDIIEASQSLGAESAGQSPAYVYPDPSIGTLEWSTRWEYIHYQRTQARISFSPVLLLVESSWA